MLNKLTKESLIIEANVLLERPSAVCHATAVAYRHIANHEDLAKYEAQAEEITDLQETIALRDEMIVGYKQRILEREDDLATNAIAISERNQAIRELRGLIEMIRAAAESEMGPVDEVKEVLDKTKMYAIGD